MSDPFRESNEVQPQWIPAEIREAEAIAAAIANCRLPRRRPPLKSALNLKLSEALDLAEGLGGTTRALPVRQLLRALDFDERRCLPWRLEHKLMQALILRSWAPESIPVTCGLRSLARGLDRAALPGVLKSRFPAGFVLKAALGDSSGESFARGVTNGIPESMLLSEPRGILDEEYVVQERIPIAVEYRVHSLEEDIIEDLTFRRYEPGSIAGERKGPNGFVKSVLDRLPDALVGGSLLAWDIGLDASGSFTVIEVN
ncbi:MAG TPA: hypothetical protein VHC72_17845, partial [Bryobacteraceae bacterium]|nr:hypothetical protein [Bryobacteraceae bacterium]